MSEWANALPLAHIHISPWGEIVAFLSGVVLLIWDGMRKSLRYDEVQPKLRNLLFPAPTPELRGRIIRIFHG